ncbi:N-acetyl-gamma-glutamyl-phosphate reductase [Candidatus Poriferisodalis sp.]|uniref:N-acetyl-gamma-glutamyl-phosphate reductase n=1 Tax=Candidatus Poriferisodalis sp. TaxID=3101277 RepID=UPI003B01BB6E
MDPQPSLKHNSATTSATTDAAKPASSDSAGSSVRVGIVGASGYTGSELMRLMAGHPFFDVVAIAGDTQAGTAVRDLYPSLAADYGSLRYSTYDPGEFVGLDVVFLGLPHMASAPVVADLYRRVGCVVDLGSDFRLLDAEAYPKWYGAQHPMPELLGELPYGLPELGRAALRGAAGIAVPGCYPTAAALALAPFARNGHISTEGVVVDAASGVSGAGRGPKPATTFSAVDEDFVAYGLLDHRHTPEIEQATGCEVLFTPHLAPMVRGILATCYARPAGELTTEEALDVLSAFYADEPFVVVHCDAPHTKATLGANTCHLSARVDSRTGWLVVLSAIDNLVKGASGAAVQCANLALGLPETAGLPTTGLMP